MSNKVGIARNQEIFLAMETTRGTLVPPTSAGLVIAAGFGSMNQQPSFTNSPEINSSRDIINRFQDKTPAGDWGFPTIARPSGSLGVAPQEDVLMESLLGDKTVNASTSVVYSPALEKPSFSLWMRKDHTVFFASGCTSGTMKFGVSTKGGAQLDWSGNFMKMGWCGTDAVATTASSGAVSVIVDNAKKYTVGAIIEFVESDIVKNNSDAGYRVIGVNTTTNTLTLHADDGLEEEISSGAIVRGWLPDGTEVGNALEARKSVAMIDGSEFKVQSLDLTINDAPKYLDDEITEDGYCEEYGEVQRDSNGNISIYFREDDVQFFDDGLNNVERALTLKVGTVAGSILEFGMTRNSLSVPTVQESDPTVALSIPYQVLGTNGEDSITATYK